MKNMNMLFKFIAKQLKGQKKIRGNSGRFRNYYLSVKDDKRNRLAKTIDYCLWRIVIFFIAFFIIYSKTLHLLWSIALSSIFFYLFHRLAIRSRNKRFEQIKRKKRKYIASQRVYDELMNKTMEEIKDYITEVFQNVGFHNFQYLSQDSKSILINAVYKKEEVMILFNIYKHDFFVELKEVKEFLHKLVGYNMKKGILITTSDFTSDSYEFSEQLNKQYGLMLINKEKLLKIIENGGLFPNEDEIDEIIESKINRKERGWIQYKQAMLSNKKGRGYIYLSLYLILFAWYTPYEIYYMIVAGFSLALAMITFMLRLFNRRKNDEETGIDFGELLKDL